VLVSAVLDLKVTRNGLNFFVFYKCTIAYIVGFDFYVVNVREYKNGTLVKKFE
jgi:hypothetical protein